MILSKDIVTDAARSAAHVLRTPTDVSRHGTDGTTPWDRNTAIWSTRLTNPVWIGGSNTGSPSRTGSQYIIIPRGSIGPQWIRDAQPLNTSINGIYSKNMGPSPTWIKVVGQKFTKESSADVKLHCWKNFGSDAIHTKSTTFVNLGLASVHTSDEIGSVFIPTTRIRLPTDGSNWLPTSHRIGKVTDDRLSRTGSE